MMEDKLASMFNLSTPAALESDSHSSHDGGILYFTYIRNKLTRKKDDEDPKNKVKALFTTEISLPPAFADNATELLEVIRRPSPLYGLGCNLQLEEKQDELSSATLPKLSLVENLIQRLSEQEKRVQQGKEGGGPSHPQGAAAAAAAAVESSSARQRHSALARSRYALRKGLPCHSEHGNEEKVSLHQAHHFMRPQTAAVTARKRSLTSREVRPSQPPDVLRLLDKGAFPLRGTEVYSQLVLPKGWEEVVSISLAASKTKDERNAAAGLPAKGKHPEVSLRSIRSYHVLLDLRDPDMPLETRSPGYHLLESGSSIARENLNRLRHNFKHIQYTKQVELIDSLKWRSSYYETGTDDSDHAKTRGSLFGPKD